ncbi:MAG: hypothetical protein R2750_10485 [Bacteroidales bacterium]
MICLFIGGNWTNENTGYDNYFGFNPGTGSTVIFSSDQHGFITSNAPRRLWNLIIDKEGNPTYFGSNSGLQVFEFFAHRWTVGRYNRRTYAYFPW